MGGIISVSEMIERARFTSLKRGRVYKGAELIVMERRDGGTGPDVALVKLADGSFSVLGSRHTPNGNWAVLSYGVSHFDQCVLQALVTLGAVSQADMDAHVAAAKKAAERRDRDATVRRLLECCDELGVIPPEGL